MDAGLTWRRWTSSDAVRLPASLVQRQAITRAIILCRAAALLHTIVRLEPLPRHNSLFAAFVAAQYMDQSSEGTDPPYGALSDLVRKVRDTRLSVYAVAATLHSWRV
ncbi:hypothetical protein GCM10018980_71710 [Streptomyces capoamus]|uniref:Uncharacterized protein n=1 Tax=Streptomyces capoamus TaxID=68183 RepID=A0A919KFW9_9ACTN|nr:toxin Doc [Streptomyces capoamus]GGW13308.1 hypothetical protein GCM10010501_16350 [Streptomyces libani subsp. rufus]GHG74701.1 hypothetical protein GCM10018980_71710 [Streptomyces capoamus]